MGIRELTIYINRKDPARKLRRENTVAEEKLWGCVRNRQLGGFKFRRQFPLGPFFVDFCCLEKRLVIEVDGQQHADITDQDNNRTRFLSEKGFRVLRFWNAEVLTNLDRVCEQILKDLEG